MNLPRLLYSICFLLMMCMAAEAQPDQYKFTRLGVDQGLSNNQPKCFLKDSHGFMWIGTLSGLNRYNGYNLKIFRNDPLDSTSLIDSDINKLFEDPDGKIWVSTYPGINIYDPDTETFQRNPRRTLRKYGMPDGLVLDIKKDKNGNFWFIHATSGLFRYTPGTKKVLNLTHLDADTMTLASNEILSLSEDPGGNFWLIHKNGVLEKLDAKTLKVVYRNYDLHKKYTHESLDYRVTTDADGDVWIYVVNYNKGVYYFKSSTHTMLHIHEGSQPFNLDSDIIGGVVQDSKGLIWVATDHGGINLLNKKTGTVRYILHDPQDEKTLSESSIRVLYKDNDGFIWAGTFKRGVNYFHENGVRFQLFKHDPANPRSLPFDDINCFEEDDKGNLWIGTNGGGLIYYDRKSESFSRFLNDPLNSNSLSNNVIVSLCIDHAGNLWIGTYFGGLNRYDGKKFTRFKRNPSDPKSIGDDSIWEIFEDSQQNLWIGTVSNGVDIYDYRKNSFLHYNVTDPNSVHSAYVPVIREDKMGNIWIGSGYGIDLYERQSGRFIHYLNDINNPQSLINNSIHTILEDSRGIIWIGTKEGLDQYDRETNSFKAYRTENGLAHNTILALQEDEHANLWMSTPNGISSLKLTRGEGMKINAFEFKNYDESDGLQGKQFNEDASCKTSRGELIFAGAKGFNLFRADEITEDTSKLKIILSDFQIFNKSLKIGESIHGNVILSKSIGQAKEITLKHSDNVFSLEFAALNFFHPEKSQYRYKLEGFNKEWIAADATQRRVTYTNLDPGDYTFIVKASNNDGIWNEDGLMLKIHILPPFWKTNIAFVIYIILILGALLLSRQLILERERMKYKIDKERQEAQQVHELDMMKIKFFTNVSHEFRTPLTLILTPIEKILKNTTDPVQQTQFQMIYRNAKRLLNLVNQLLDFRKLEVQEVKLNPSEGDIIKFIKDTSHSFSDLSDKKNIEFSFQSDIDSFETIFDQDKLEKILFNLLSNAFKFTQAHGKISVNVSVVKRSSDSRWLEIKVHDTGIGIPVENQDKIFERFFQHDLPNSMVNQGSGIGLSITKEFVKAHGGTITVESEPYRGTVFTMLIPVQEISKDRTQEVAAEDKQDEPDVILPGEEMPDTGKNKKPVLLLVEDNEDFRFYLKDNLKAQYRILEAANGKEGLKMAAQYIPDLIVSDVMMPEMNGIDLCRKIKNDRILSHVPVILLTARTSEEQKLEGFDTGADDYITKPFSFEILQSRIKNLIHQREGFQKDFRRQIEVKASDVNITSLDEKLIHNAIKLVEERISDADFSVENLSQELGMSRVHLYKKLVSLTGKSPLEFIRSIRLQRAAQLLDKSQLTVAEIAYQVGFNNPKYFAKYFKDEFNVLPSVYAASKKKNES